MSSQPFPTLPAQSGRTQSLYLEIVSEAGGVEGRAMCPPPTAMAPFWVPPPAPLSSWYIQSGGMLLEALWGQRHLERSF